MSYVFNHLGRDKDARKALLKSLAYHVIMKKRIFTTVAKAKALRPFLEPILTLSKQDNMSSRRNVFSIFQNKEVVKELFNNISKKIESRNGGYLRIIKLPNRMGDNAAMAMVEMVDYNNDYKK
jgi:large subunit ribosomal protein L17